MTRQPITRSPPLSVVRTASLLARRVAWGAVAVGLAAASFAYAQSGVGSAPRGSPELRGAPDEEAPPPPGGMETVPLGSPFPAPQAAPLPAPVRSPAPPPAPLPPAPLAAPAPVRPIAAPVRPVIPPAPNPFATTPRAGERVITPPTLPAAAPPVAASAPVPVLLPPAPAARTGSPWFGAPRPATPPPVQAAVQPQAPVAAVAAAPAVIAFASTAQAVAGVRVSATPNLCIAARGGLGPMLETGGRPAVLTACDSTAAPMQLIDGVVYVGAERRHILIPAVAPASGCRTLDTLSRQRRTLTGVCVRPDADPDRFEEDLRAAGWGRINTTVKAAGPAYAAGAPLMVVPVGPENPANPAWSFVPATGQLRTSDGSLCVGGVTGDLTPGAPVLLRPCGERPLRVSF